MEGMAFLFLHEIISLVIQILDFPLFVIYVLLGSLHRQDSYIFPVACLYNFILSILICESVVMVAAQIFGNKQKVDGSNMNDFSPQKLVRHWVARLFGEVVIGAVLFALYTVVCTQIQMYGWIAQYDMLRIPMDIFLFPVFLGITLLFGNNPNHASIAFYIIPMLSFFYAGIVFSIICEATRFVSMFVTRRKRMVFCQADISSATTAQDGVEIAKQ